MDGFVEFLKLSKYSLENDTFNEIHIVLGNESCDLDSCISSLALAYYLYKSKPCSTHALVVPVQNVSYENFSHRLDNCFVLQEAGVPLHLLIYRDQIDFGKLLNNKKVQTTLVDHHVLNDKDSILEKTVVQVYDHRPMDAAVNWDQSNIKIRIEQVGSCSTLVVDEILKTQPTTLFRELAYMIYETIIYDTIALLPENGRAKELDINLASELQKLHNFNEDVKMLYQKLWKMHNDVSHLSPKQMLYKDLKIVKNIPVPGLPMLLVNFLKLENSYESIKKFAQEHNTSFVLLIGLDAEKEVKRDVGVLFSEDSIVLKDNLLEKFNNSEKLKGYNFSFCEVQTNYNDIICLRQYNVKLSRKQIIPLLEDCLSLK